MRVLLDPILRELGNRRFQEPRIAQFPYAPCEEVPRTLGIQMRCAAPTSEESRSLLLAGNSAELSAEPNERSYAGAVAKLAGGHVGVHIDETVRCLEKLCRLEPARAQFWSDLAAAYLVRGNANNWPQDFWEAAQAAQRAVALAPDRPEGWHNLSIARERLFLRRGAIQSWRRAWVLERRSGWREEIEAHLRALASNEPSRQREEMEKRLLAGEKAAILAAFSDNPQLPREVAQQLFPDWAAATLAGRSVEAARIAALLATIGDHSRQNGDPFLAAASAGFTGPRARSLALGVAELSAATKGATDLDPTPCATFRRLARELQLLSSPLALEARRQECACIYRGNEYRLAGGMARELTASLRSRGFPSLEAKVWWIVGSAAYFQGDIDEARAAFTAALALFERTGETGNHAAMVGQLATIAWEAGEASRSFRERQQSIEAALRVAEPRLPVLYLSGATELTRRNPMLALAFIEEAQSLQGGDNQIRRFDGAMLRGPLRLRLGDRKAAVADLAAGTQILEAIRDADQRRSLEVSRLAFSAELALEPMPARAIREVERAIAICRAEEQVKLPGLLETKARAELAIGDLEAAHATLGQALETFENLAAKTRNLSDRVRLFDRAEDLVEMAIDIDVKRKEPAVALDDFERFHSRFLLTQIGGRARTAVELSRSVIAGEVLLVFQPSARALRIWKVDSTGVEFRSVVTSRETIEKWIERWRSGLQKGELQPAEGSRLHDLLIRPLGLQPGSKLSIAATGALARAPFAALFDATTSRFLVQDFQLVRVPSGSVRARILELAGRVPAQPSAGSAVNSALIVGNPEFAQDVAPEAESLKYAGEEAAALAASWPGSTHFEGARATAAAFLAEAPGHQVLHFSGHALVDRANPFAVTLLFAPDEKHPSGELGALEIFQKKLPDTRLAVLAACGTGTGYASPTEGLLDLSHPFLAAGVPSVVTTLWDIPDRSETSEFLLAFYSAFRCSGNAVEALRSAQVQCLGSGKSSHRNPRIWAAFQAVGVETSPQGGYQ